MSSARWVHRMDAAGLLQHELRLAARAWLRVLPQRSPDAAPAALTGRTFKLRDGVLLRPGDKGLTLEAPGAWAQVQLLKPDLAVLLDALARGCGRSRARRLLPHATAVVEPFLQTLAWCDLLAEPEASAWLPQDLLFHSRSRRGFGREPVGKVRDVDEAEPWPDHTANPRVAMPRGDAADLQAPLAQTLAERQSRREHGPAALPLAALGRFLWHSLAVQLHEGRLRRAYPSGGRCYALRPFVAVAHCAGLGAGLYAYDTMRHELVLVRASDAALDALMREAAASAQCQAAPQVLVVLCADYARMRSAYGALGYSLVLKEVGAVMQTAQLVATALGLACCPLGTGDGLKFAALSGTDALELPSVGEWLLGMPA